MDGFAPIGASCGDAHPFACNDPDSCDGRGVCLSNEGNAVYLAGTPTVIGDNRFTTYVVFEGTTDGQDDCEPADGGGICFSGAGFGDLRFTWQPPRPGIYAVRIRKDSATFDPAIQLFAPSGFAETDSPCEDDFNLDQGLEEPYVWFTATCENTSGVEVCERIEIVLDSDQGSGSFTLDIIDHFPECENCGVPECLASVGC